MTQSTTARRRAKASLAAAEQIQNDHQKQHKNRDGDDDRRGSGPQQVAQQHPNHRRDEQQFNSYLDRLLPDGLDQFGEGFEHIASVPRSGLFSEPVGCTISCQPQLGKSDVPPGSVL